MPDYQLNGKVVLVTGASSGIGRGCAIAFGAEGAKVVVTGRDQTALGAAKAEVEAAGAKEVLTISADLSILEDCARVISETVAHFGQLDVLVNNAGILVPGGVENLPMEKFDQQMNINTRSVFYLCQQAVPHLLKTKGNVVNVSSVTGLRAFPGVAAYNMSKAAVDHLTRTLALEVAGRGVRVNAVNPGVIVTEVHKRGGMSPQDYEKFLEHGKETHALGRVGEVSEVAASVLFLASSAASFITGITMAVDGGRHAMCPR